MRDSFWPKRQSKTEFVKHGASLIGESVIHSFSDAKLLMRTGNDKLTFDTIFFQKIGKILILRFRAIVGLKNLQLFVASLLFGCCFPHLGLLLHFDGTFEENDFERARTIVDGGSTLAATKRSEAEGISNIG